MQIPMESITTAMMDGTIGFCLACGSESYNVEPDARKYHCSECDADEVYGAEEILMMGETVDGDIPYDESDDEEWE